MLNGDIPVQTSCLNLTSAFGLDLAEAEQNNFIQIEDERLQTAANILIWIADRMTNHGWDCIYPEHNKLLIKAFTSDCKLIERFIQDT